MLGQLPKSSLGRQITCRSVIHESWHNPAHKAFVRAATTQQPCYTHSWANSSFTNKLSSHGLFTSRLVMRRVRDQQAQAMHSASSAANGVTTGQAPERPGDTASTSAGMQKGNALPCVSLRPPQPRQCCHLRTKECPEARLNLGLLHRWYIAGIEQRLGSGIQQPGSRCLQHRHCGGSAPGAERHADLPPRATAAEGVFGGEGCWRATGRPAGRSGRLQREARCERGLC